jgi:membrane-associated phospholipid phosphatase
MCIVTSSGALLAFSRIALGAHFLTDVLGAIAFGIFWLAFCLFATKPVRRRMVPTPAMPFISELAIVPVESTEKPAQSLLS